MASGQIYVVAIGDVVAQEGISIVVWGTGVTISVVKGTANDYGKLKESRKEGG